MQDIAIATDGESLNFGSYCRISASLSASKGFTNGCGAEGRMTMTRCRAREMATLSNRDAFSYGSDSFPK